MVEVKKRVKKPTGTIYVILSQPVNYTSMYGYPKRRFRVVKVEAGNTLPHSGGYDEGVIKEEKVFGENGKQVGLTYYERAGWRPNGEPRFYKTPLACLQKIGYVPAMTEEQYYETFPKAKPKVGKKKPGTKAKAEPKFKITKSGRKVPIAA